MCEKEPEVLREAVRDNLGWTTIERVRSRADLSESEALEIARAELVAYRRWYTSGE
jgi:hypothetical protein